MSLLAVPLHTDVLLALEDEPLSLMDLRRAAGSPPQTTMRGHLRALTEKGILERRREPSFPGAVDYGLAPAGQELLDVARRLQAWLREAPEGPIELGSTSAKGTVKALVEGWSSGIIRALAARPLSLTELSSIIPGLSYPSLERRLTAMRLSGQIEPCAGSSSRGTPYQPTGWLRRGVAPIAAAARWERRFQPEEASPIAKIDVESIFLLSLPLVRLPREDGGVCRLGTESRNGKGERVMAGALAVIKEGRLVSCGSQLEGGADAWALGSVGGWLRAILDGDSGDLELGGDSGLVRDLLEGLNSSLPAARQTA